MAVIECNQINQVVNQLLIAFEDCNKIKNSDLRKLVDLSVALHVCSNEGSSETGDIQHNATENIQGGSLFERFHLTQEEHNNLEFLTNKVDSLDDEGYTEGDDFMSFYTTVKAVNDGLNLKVDKVTGKSLVFDTEITKLSHLDDTTDLQKPVSLIQEARIQEVVNVILPPLTGKPRLLFKGVGNTNQSIIQVGDLCSFNDEREGVDGIWRFNGGDSQVIDDYEIYSGGVKYFEDLATQQNIFGDESSLYVDLTTNKIYRFVPNGELYIELGSSTPTLQKVLEAGNTATEPISISTNGSTAILGSSQNGFGVRGSSVNDKGVSGYSANDNGLFGESTNGSGVFAQSENGNGIYGHSINKIASFFRIFNTTKNISEWYQEVNLQAHIRHDGLFYAKKLQIAELPDATNVVGYDKRVVVKADGTFGALPIVEEPVYSFALDEFSYSGTAGSLSFFGTMNFASLIIKNGVVYFNMDFNLLANVLTGESLQFAFDLTNLPPEVNEFYFEAVAVASNGTFFWSVQHIEGTLYVSLNPITVNTVNTRLFTNFTQPF